MATKRYLLLIFFLMTSFVFALPNDAGNVIDFKYNLEGNYTGLNTNNSIYWNGHSWNNIDNDFVMGSLNVTSGDTKIYTDILDAGGGNTVPFLRGIGGTYDIFGIGGGIIVDWKSSFPYGIIFYNDEDDDGVGDNQIAFQWDITKNILKLNDMLGETTDFSVDGNIYEQSTHRVCTAENGLCEETLTETDPLWTGNQSSYYNTTEVDSLVAGAGLWTNESGVITSAEDDVNVTGNLYVENITSQNGKIVTYWSDTLDCWITGRTD